MTMKRATKITVGVVALGVVGTAAGLLASSGSDDEDVSTVAVERGEIVDRALAVGQIEPDVEIGVKSQIAGVVARRFADVGDARLARVFVVPGVDGGGDRLGLPVGESGCSADPSCVIVTDLPNADRDLVG
jgi:hypothetical protein